MDAASYASSHLGHNGMEGNMKALASPLTLLPQDAGDESPACLDVSSGRSGIALVLCREHPSIILRLPATHRPLSV